MTNDHDNPGRNQGRARRWGVVLASTALLLTALAAAVSPAARAIPICDVPEPPPACDPTTTTRRSTTTRPPAPSSALVYAIPYGPTGSVTTYVKVTNDHISHTPPNRLDMKGTSGSTPYRVVAARAGTIEFIQDSFDENRPGQNPCNNNYVWIRHGTEWTKYSHVRKDSVRKTAGRAVGDRVEAGTFLGYEGDVGCASGPHLHWEVAVPTDPDDPIDSQGFIKGTNRVPRVCIPYLGPPNEPDLPSIGTLRDGSTYRVAPGYHASCGRRM